MLGGAGSVCGSWVAVHILCAGNRAICGICESDPRPGPHGTNHFEANGGARNFREPMRTPWQCKQRGERKCSRTHEDTMANIPKQICNIRHASLTVHQTNIFSSLESCSLPWKFLVGTHPLSITPAWHYIRCGCFPGCTIASVGCSQAGFQQGQYERLY